MNEHVREAAMRRATIMEQGVQIGLQGCHTLKSASRLKSIDRPVPKQSLACGIFVDLFVAIRHQFRETPCLRQLFVGLVGSNGASRCFPEADSFQSVRAIFSDPNLRATAGYDLNRRLRSLSTGVPWAILRCLRRFILRRRMFVVFFVLAFAFRVAIALALKSGSTLPAMKTIAPDIWTTSTEMEGIAVNVAEYGDYYLNGVTTAHYTPAFPLYLAGVFSIFGTGLLARIVIVTLSCAVSALRCGLVPLFAIDAGLGPRVGALAGGISVLYIGALQTDISGGLDGPFVAIALLVLVWTVLRLWRDGSWQTRTPWWFFAFCGLSALLNPNLLPVIGGFLLVGAVACPAGARLRYLRQTALLALCVLACLLPWAIRNYLSLGAPILTRSNFGLEFWLSNGPGRTFDLPHNYGTYHPSVSKIEADRLVDLGEVEYNRLRLTEAVGWVWAHPAEFLHLTAQRLAAWWFPPRPAILVVPLIVLTLLAITGLWLMFRHQPMVAWLFLVTWITFPDVYYIVQWSSRYRYPMDWQILLCASVALIAGYQTLISRSRGH